MEHDASELEVLPEGALSRIEMSEIDMQITTAKKYPRSLATLKKRAMEMVTLNAATAKECFYSLRRQGADGPVVIEGASVRLAEILTCCWGNMRAGLRIARTEEGFIYGEGFAHDLETNFAIRLEVGRRITGKGGRRYGDDMIGVTGNAAAALAYRNAVLKVVPKSLWSELLNAAKLTVRGDIKDLESRRKRMLAEFLSVLKVTEEMILSYLQINGIEDIGLDELVDLTGVFSGIKNGEISVAEAFSPRQAEESGAPRRKSEQGPQAVQTPPTEPGMATPEDVQSVLKAGLEAGLTQVDIKAVLMHAFGVESVGKIKHDDIPKAISLMKPAEKKEDAKPEPVKEKAEPAAEDNPIVTAAEAEAIQKLAFDNGWDIREQKKYLKKTFEIDDFKKLRRSQLPELQHVFKNGQ